MAELHPDGQSVWVRNDQDMETLFRQGFFGKGTLSRSEATWKQRNTKDASQSVPLEDITRQRRVERAKIKKEKQQGALNASSTASSPLVASTVASSCASPLPGTPPSAIQETLLTDSNKASTPATPSVVASYQELAISVDTKEDANYEHLQLSLEEAFFLVFAVECIAVFDATTSLSLSATDKHRRPLSIQECWIRFAEASTLKPNMRQCPSTEDFALVASNPFIVRYVAYHYYRSKGWVVKDGLKYGTDFLLYKKGLVFGHSQYGVKVIAVNGDLDNMAAEEMCPVEDRHGKSAMSSVYSLYSFMSLTPGLCRPHAVYSWQWLLTLNRVIAQVQKTVVLCHVVVPTDISKRQLSHPRTTLPLYQVVEVGAKRFVPEKNRA
ncbi:tRNA splicing endonuclease subunit sen2 [Mortierella polycephala]|uniref:tRNA-splicing endonuclease subunit Sen2 n=1 Tax=Mortierella polycephala TaxID=41804 RepID=A0A9P6PW79_9FUNG|nr:tRNA splicing endonuclease subunit sen2 [Mortierella polycephala]